MRRPVRVTSEAVEKNIRLQREFDDRQRQLESFSNESANLLSAANAQTKIESQRRLLQQQVCQTEKQQEEELLKAQYDKKFRDLTIAQNQALAIELDKDAADKERRSREIQKICEESQELKELDQVLKIAYLNKERAAQWEEKVILATREQEREYAIEQEMENQRLIGLKQDIERNSNKRANFDQDRIILQRQLKEKEDAIAEAKRQMHQEREMVDAIVAKINEEDQREYEKRREKQLETAMMVRRFEEERKIEVEAAKAREKAEEDYIAAYNKAMEERGAGVAAKKQAARDEADRVFKQIVEETERKKAAQEEFNNLRDMLWEEELEAKRAMDAKARTDKQKNMRREMMEANEKMLAQKKIIMEEQAVKDAKLLDIMRKKFAEDEAKERAEEQARKDAKIHHMTLVEKQRQERKNMYEAERAQEYAFIDENNRREEYRQKVIKEARKRLLEQHAAALQGFFPRKAFENQEEYEHFQQVADEQQFKQQHANTQRK